MDLYDTNSHKFVLLSYELVCTNSHKFVSQEKLNRGFLSREHFCTNWYLLVRMFVRSYNSYMIPIRTFLCFWRYKKGWHKSYTNLYINVSYQWKNLSSKKIDIPLIPRYGGTCAIWYKIIRSTIRKTRYTNSFRCHIIQPLCNSMTY